MIAVVLLVLGVVVAAIDWWAVQTERRRHEQWAKPATMVVLVAVAATWGDAPADARAWIVCGAVLGLIGDVALLGQGETAFLAGLGSFAAGHLAYAVAATSIGLDPLWALPGAAVMAVLLGYRFVTRTMAGAYRAGGGALAAAVAVYAVVITAMVVTAWATGVLLAAIGATSFAVSDWVLGHRRFAGPLPGGRLAIMVPYHVGQALLIVGLAAG